MAIWPGVLAVFVGLATAACSAPHGLVPPEQTPVPTASPPGEGGGIDMESARYIALSRPNQVQVKASDGSCLVTWEGFTQSSIGYEVFRKARADADWELVAAVPHTPESTRYAWLDPHALGGGHCLYGVASVSTWRARSEIRAAK